MKALTWGVVLGTAMLASVGVAQAQQAKLITGSVGGVDYRIEVPQSWNGTLLLWSHGGILPGAPNPAVDAPAGTGAWLLNQGYALAGSAFSSVGWQAGVVAPADNIALLDYFTSAVGKPKRTIAWGGSLGGLISAGMLQKYPERFDGSVLISGNVGGGVAFMNTRLDPAFVIKTLLPGASDLEVVNISNPEAAVARAKQILAQAQASPEGRARVALAAAVGDVPGWFDPTSPPPAPSDYLAQEAAQSQWLSTAILGTGYMFRRGMEQQAGGNASSNVGVDYREQLERSVNRDEVHTLYQAAKLDLEADMNALSGASRIQADPQAAKYVNQLVLDGRLQVPVLTLHDTGDGNVVVQHESAYGNVVRAAGQAELLRQLYVNRAGHNTYTPAEEISALLTLIHRLDTGRWEGVGAAALNAQAAALGPELNTFPAGAPQATALPSAFVEFLPAPFLRPWDARCLSAVPVIPLIGQLSPVCL